MIESQNKPSKKSRTQHQDRITLTASANKKSDLWLKQVQDTFSGMINLKRADIVCTIIDDMPDILPATLLEKVKRENLTDLQKAKWVYQKLKDAKGSTEPVDFDALVKKAQGLPEKRGKTRNRISKKNETISVSSKQFPNSEGLNTEPKK